MRQSERCNRRTISAPQGRLSQCKPVSLKRVFVYWSFHRRQARARRARRAEEGAAAAADAAAAAAAAPVVIDPEKEPGEAAILAAKDPANLRPAPVTSKSDPRLTPVLGLDCEMVGVGASGKTSVLAQVCIVNQRMETIYLSYVKPKERVTGEPACDDELNY